MTSTMRFEDLLQATLHERVDVSEPRGFSQCIMARLSQQDSIATPEPPFIARAASSRESRSVWMALMAHAAVLLLVFGVMRTRLQITAPLLHRTVLTSKLEALVPVRPTLAGGGGGAHNNAPVTQAHLPQVAQQQVVPPKAPPMLAPKLALQPTIVADLKMPNNTMPNMGSPTSTLNGFSLGNGSGGGVGAGNGNGIGPGSGGNTGGGVYHVGGGISEPKLIKEVVPEYSEEARKAKFSGNVEVYLIVDEQGNATHVQVARSVGMGLDEKAIEAVRQWKFKPATKDGKPVKVDMYVDVNCQIF